MILLNLFRRIKCIELSSKSACTKTTINIVSATSNPELYSELRANMKKTGKARAITKDKTSIREIAVLIIRFTFFYSILYKPSL